MVAISPIYFTFLNLSVAKLVILLSVYIGIYPNRRCSIEGVLARCSGGFFFGFFHFFFFVRGSGPWPGPKPISLDFVYTVPGKVRLPRLCLVAFSELWVGLASV